MSLRDFLKKQFIDVIQWTEPEDGILAYRYPMQDMEIQNGGKLTVRDSQMAAFVNEVRELFIRRQQSINLERSNVNRMRWQFVVIDEQGPRRADCALARGDFDHVARRGARGVGQPDDARRLWARLLRWVEQVQQVGERLLMLALVFEDELEDVCVAQQRFVRVEIKPSELPEHARTHARQVFFHLAARGQVFRRFARRLDGIEDALVARAHIQHLAVVGAGQPERLLDVLGQLAQALVVLDREGDPDGQTNLVDRDPVVATACRRAASIYLRTYGWIVANDRLTLPRTPPG